MAADTIKNKLYVNPKKAFGCILLLLNVLGMYYNMFKKIRYDFNVWVTYL